MKKDIYKITNNVNGKCYIGQSNNPQRRFQEHIRGDDPTEPIYLAIKKYGLNNFSFNIIEKNIENYNEREKKWINFYHSNTELGYNRTEGGENPPIQRGEDSGLAKIDNQTFHQLEQDIIDTKLSFLEIAKKYNCTECYISQINRGIARRNKNLNYPLRPAASNILDEDLVELIIHDLIYTHLPTTHIAKKYHVGEVIVWEINKGKNYRKDFIIYPIREDYSKYSNWFLDNLYTEIKNNQYKFSTIQEMYNISKSTLNRINQGKIHSRPNEAYPLRDNSQRVH